MKQHNLKDYARIPEHISQSYIRAAHNLQEEPMVKRKISMALVVAIIMVLITVTAIAAVLLSGKEFVQEVMVPKAQESQMESWTEDEVREILRVAEENGLQLTEEQKTQLLDRGGYYKEELMRIFVKLDLGDQPSTWSIEDQAWYSQMLIDIGLNTESSTALPEEGEATETETLAVVQARIHETDPNAPLMDETIYRRHTTYLWTPVDDGTLVKQWNVEYEPLDLIHAKYRFVLDTQANILREWTEPGIANMEDVPRPEALRYRFEELYGNFYGWEMEAWVEFQDLLRQAVAVHGVEWDDSLAFISLSTFALPDANALAKDAAIDRAVMEVMAQENVQADSLKQSEAYAVYLSDEDSPVWKTTIPTALQGDYLVEINALTGEVRNLHFAATGSSRIARHFMLESVYRAAMEGLQTQTGEIHLANRNYQSVAPLADGSFLLVGSALRDDGTTQAWAARIGADGQTLWDVLHEEGTEYTEAVAQSDGTYLLAMTPRKGEHFSLALVTLDESGQLLTGPINLPLLGWADKGKDCLLISEYVPQGGVSSSAIRAVNAKGEILWEQPDGALKEYGYRMHTSDEGYLLTGSEREYPYDQESNMWGMMGRMDDDGNLLWTGVMEEHPYTAISKYTETSDGGVLGTGSYYRRYEDDAEEYQSLSDFVVRFDAAGNVLWCRYYLELDPVDGTIFLDMLPAPNDGALLLARTLAGGGYTYYQLDRDGNVVNQWKPQFAIMNILGEGMFTAGGQDYLIYRSRAEYGINGVNGPISTYIAPIVWPEM